MQKNELTIAIVASTFATALLLMQGLIPLHGSSFFVSSVVDWFFGGLIFSGWALAALYQFREIPGFFSGVRLAALIWVMFIAQDLVAGAILPWYASHVADLAYTWKGTFNEVVATLVFLGVLGVVADKYWAGRRV